MEIDIDVCSIFIAVLFFSLFFIIVVDTRAHFDEWVSGSNNITYFCAFSG